MSEEEYNKYVAELVGAIELLIDCIDKIAANILKNDALITEELAQIKGQLSDLGTRQGWRVLAKDRDFVIDDKGR